MDVVTRIALLGGRILRPIAICQRRSARRRVEMEAGEPDGGRTMDMTIESPAFEHNGEVPTVYTCDGRDISPELRWSGVPEDAKSLVLIVDDPDAPDPDAPKMTWVHWVLYDIPADATGLPQDVAPDDLPEGTRHGTNNWERTGYGGPCPPIGRHRYFFKLYALDKELGNLGGPTSDELTEAMEDHVLAEAQLIGTYSRR